MKSLRRAPASSQPAPAAAATWGRPQRFLVIGLLIVVLAALAASALYHQLPPRFPGLPSAEAERQRVAAMPIREMRRYYYQWLLPGLDVAEPPEIQQRRNRIYLGLGTLAVFGVIGAIFAGAGVVGMVRRGVQ